MTMSLQNGLIYIALNVLVMNGYYHSLGTTKMCKHGPCTEVEVTIQAHLSHTGKTRKKLAKIDSCIALIVKALEDGGVMMLASCCGHGKTDGRIDLVDGRTLMILPPKESEVYDQTCPECGETEYYRIVYTDDEMTEIMFYDCMMCYTHWDEDGNNLGKF